MHIGQVLNVTDLYYYIMHTRPSEQILGVFQVGSLVDLPLLTRLNIPALEVGKGETCAGGVDVATVGI